MSYFGRSKVQKVAPAMSITNAQQSLTNDQRGRQQRYFISMMIRTFCFVAAVFLHGPYRWIAMAGAAVLPYVSVVVANAGRESVSGPNSIMKKVPRQLTKD